MLKIGDLADRFRVKFAEDGAGTGKSPLGFRCVGRASPGRRRGGCDFGRVRSCERALPGGSRSAGALEASKIAVRWSQAGSL